MSGEHVFFVPMRLLILLLTGWFDSSRTNDWLFRLFHGHRHGHLGLCRPLFRNETRSTLSSCERVIRFFLIQLGFFQNCSFNLNYVLHPVSFIDVADGADCARALLVQLAGTLLELLQLSG
uniref:Putative secreted protein ovary overexpressed n=1 Tax=Rhipicephalus microplus TaxID=6941 RepID=A0A6M2DBU3_RHIMP